MASKLEQSTTMNETIWVLGGGQFGRRAVDLLRKKTDACTIIVVEKLPVQDFPSDIEIVCGDGVEWLAEKFTPDAVVDKIIPALPVNLAADWLVKKLSDEYRTVLSIEIADECLHQLPHPLRISSSRVVTSHADFLCPPNCSEPDDICTYTRRQRPQPLYRILETMTFGNFVQLTVRSHQFASGVGGYFPADLWNLLKRARLLANTPLLVGTACKCHGIVDGIYYK